MLSIYPLQEEDERGAAVLLTRSFADKDGRGFREIRCLLTSCRCGCKIICKCQPLCSRYKSMTERSNAGTMSMRCFKVLQMGSCWLLGWCHQVQTTSVVVIRYKHVNVTHLCRSVTAANWKVFNDCWFGCTVVQYSHQRANAYPSATRPSCLLVQHCCRSTVPQVWAHTPNSRKPSLQIRIVARLLLC